MESVFRWNVFKLLLEDGLTDQTASGFRWWTKGVIGRRPQGRSPWKIDERTSRRLTEAKGCFRRGAVAEAQGCGETMMLMADTDADADVGANAAAAVMGDE